MITKKQIDSWFEKYANLEEIAESIFAAIFVRKDWITPEAKNYLLLCIYKTHAQDFFYSYLKRSAYIALADDERKKQGTFLLALSQDIERQFNFIRLFSDNNAQKALLQVSFLDEVMVDFLKKRFNDPTHLADFYIDFRLLSKSYSESENPILKKVLSFCFSVFELYNLSRKWVLENASPAKIVKFLILFTDLKNDPEVLNARISQDSDFGLTLRKGLMLSDGNHRWITKLWVRLYRPMLSRSQLVN